MIPFSEPTDELMAGRLESGFPTLVNFRFRMMCADLPMSVCMTVDRYSGNSRPLADSEDPETT